MKSIVENGGLTNAPLVLNQQKRVVSVSNEKILEFMVFNKYLNAIDRCEDADALRKESSMIALELHLLKVQNPFHAGFTEDGFGVYRRDNTRVIFVECEPDLDLD